jgi:hypothetical protein
MRLLLGLAALAISGCASTDLKSVQGSSVVYEAAARGKHEELAACMADALQDHEKYVVRSQKYAVRNYPDRSEIQAYQDSIYGGGTYLFTVDLQQKDKDVVQVSLRRLAVFKEYVEAAVQACSAT